jgi:hypothetical protein
MFKVIANIDKFGGDSFDNEKYLLGNDFIFLFSIFAKKFHVRIYQ